jgi:hypothetical protein
MQRVELVHSEECSGALQDVRVVVDQCVTVDRSIPVEETAKLDFRFVVQWRRGLLFLEVSNTPM